MVLASALVLAAATVAAVASVRRRPWVFAGWGWYVVTLVPVIGLVQVGAQARADRYTYIPLVGLAIIAAWGAPDLVSRWVAREGTRRRVLAGAGSVVVVVLAAATWRQTGYWSDARSHIGRALAVTERNALAFERQGSLLASQGRFAEAEESFEAAVAIDPGFFPALVNLSAARFRLGHYREAAESAELHLKGLIDNSNLKIIKGDITNLNDVTKAFEH